MKLRNFVTMSFFSSSSEGGKSYILRATLANEHPASLYDQEHAQDADQVLENDGQASAVLINEVSIDDRGWAVIPFGDWPHEMGMQKFGREQAQRLAEGFNTMAARFKRAICGLPIFKGHPDHPVAAIANQYPDKEEKGQIAAVEVRPNGLALKLVLSNAGAELVRKGWKFISPMWICNLLSQAGDSFRVFAPAELQSVGLVVKPNIPSPSLSNAGKPANPNPHPMNPETLKLLGLAEKATPEQVHAAVKQLHDQTGALANEQTAHTTAKTALATAQQSLANAQGEVTTLKASITTLTTERDNARTTLANEVEGRINDAVANAIRTGRCTEAEKATWISRLKANFAAESAVLANAVPKVKTASEIPAMLKLLETQMTASLGNKGAEKDDGKDECGLGNADLEKMTAADKSAKMKAVINDHTAKLANHPKTTLFNTAYANAKKANPRLFGFKQEDVTGS